ncbi:sensor histidine kinase [Aurantivibrio infirmus]
MNKNSKGLNTTPSKHLGADLSFESNYKLLKIYAYYRTLLGSLLLLMFSSQWADRILGVTSAKLFAYSAFLYTLINVATLLVLWKKQFEPKTRQILVILFIDICTITILTHATGSMDSSIAYLLLICVAAGGVFLRSQLTFALAGLSTILLLAETIFSITIDLIEIKALFKAGTLGLLLFATAYIFNVLSEKIRSSNIQALLQAQQAAYLENLSQLILERMRTGILVVDNDNNVVLANHAAKSLLGCAESDNLDSLLAKKFPSISEHLKIWRAYPHTRSPHLKINADEPEIRLSFAKLEAYDDSDTLIFVEDNRKLSQQAQQLKLASLGRLTASIAHEVRNPLGAISHAAQLLGESEQAQDDDKRLSQIIQNHSRRVNHIIENVLQLSSRQAARPETIDLVIWVNEFLEVYKQSKNANILIECNSDTIKTRIDPSQLQQVLTNLCDNGLRYSLERTGEETLSIQAGIDLDSELPYIEVVDDGAGVPDQDVAQIFEPFFTTETTGSGLGLYISREICEANQATLDYKRTDKYKSCFRITFAHPDRIF